jgi:putative Mg2+ transporter-C (MgtC) family protein
MLVSIGAAGFTLVTWQLCRQLLQSDDNVQVDPVRLVEGVIGGIGFLGAGAIIESRGSVRGITTAAAIWIVGAVGVACGLAYFSIAALVTVVSIAVLYPIGYLEARYVGDARSSSDGKTTNETKDDQRVD